MWTNRAGNAGYREWRKKRAGHTIGCHIRLALAHATSPLLVQFSSVTTPILDFSHLTPEGRIELAEQLWDSIDSEAVQPADEQVAELLRRRAELAGDEDPARPEIRF